MIPCGGYMVFGVVCRYAVHKLRQNLAFEELWDIFVALIVFVVLVVLLGIEESFAAKDKGMEWGVGFRFPHCHEVSRGVIDEAFLTYQRTFKRWLCLYDIHRAFDKHVIGVYAGQVYPVCFFEKASEDSQGEVEAANQRGVLVGE